MSYLQSSRGAIRGDVSCVAWSAWPCSRPCRPQCSLLLFFFIRWAVDCGRRASSMRLLPPAPAGWVGGEAGGPGLTRPPHLPLTPTRRRTSKDPPPVSMVMATGKRRRSALEAQTRSGSTSSLLPLPTRCGGRPLRALLLVVVVGWVVVVPG